MTLSKDLPRFRQITEQLREQIGSGVYQAHSPLPSERLIAKTYNVSRMTARRALEAIETDGLAYSQNRKGRYVSPGRLRFDISSTVSFAAVAQRDGQDFDIELISSARIKAGEALAQPVSFQAQGDLYVYVRRFKVNGYAIFIETEYVIQSMFPDFLDQDLTQSSTILMEKHYGIIASTGKLVLRTRPSTAEEAELLCLSRSQNIVELEMVTFDEVGRSFSFGRQIWRAELAEFSATINVNA